MNETNVRMSVQQKGRVMRYLAIALASLGLAGLPTESRAQYPLGYYSNGYVVNPYVPAYRGYAAYASPYGYRTFSNYGVYPGPFGYNSYYNTGTVARPYVNGPFHSVYWDPFANTYRYTTGYLNTPVYSYGAYNPYYGYGAYGYGY